MAGNRRAAGLTSPTVDGRLIYLQPQWRSLVIKVVALTLAGLFAMSTIADAKPRHRHYSHHRTITDANANGVTFLPHPAGCPARLFCGCGARKHLGIDDPRLNLVANWPRLYRGTIQVAVWRGHVAVIDHMTGPHTAMLYDYNSGGHRSRHWERDISGARIVGGGYHASLRASAAPVR